MSPLDVHRTNGEPHDRQTRLAEVAAAAVQADPEWIEGRDRVIVLISDDGAGGATWQGYEGDDVQALVDTIEHLQALARSTGRDVQVHPLPGRG